MHLIFTLHSQSAIFTILERTTIVSLDNKNILILFINLSVFFFNSLLLDLIKQF